MTLDELIASSSAAAYYRHALKQLSEAQRSPLAQWAIELHQNGASEPLSWAHSEVTENIAQRARFFALKELWHSASDVQGNVDAAEDFTEAAQVGYRDIVQAIGQARAHAFLQAYGRGMLNVMANIIDDGNAGAPVGWRLMEVDANGELTGRNVGGLHEDLLEFDTQLSESSVAQTIQQTHTED